MVSEFHKLAEGCSNAAGESESTKAKADWRNKATYFPKILNVLSIFTQYIE